MIGVVAINICKGNIIYNTNYPFLMYYDGQTNIRDAILSQEELKLWIMKNVISLDLYAYCELRYITYINDQQNHEDVHFGKIPISDIISINDAFDNIYHEALVEMFNTVDVSLLKSNYGLTKTTILNGIRQSLYNHNISANEFISIVEEKLNKY